MQEKMNYLLEEMRSDVNAEADRLGQEPVYTNLDCGQFYTHITNLIYCTYLEF